MASASPSARRKPPLRLSPGSQAERQKLFHMSPSNDQVFIPMSQANTDGLPGMTPKDQKTFTEGAVLSFHNIYYRVKVKSGSLLSQKTVEKEILMNIKAGVLFFLTMNQGFNSMTSMELFGVKKKLFICTGEGFLRDQRIDLSHLGACGRIT